MIRPVLRLLAAALSGPELPLTSHERRRIPSGESRSRDGACAEDLATVFLAIRGYRVLCRGRANSQGEVDIVARQHGVLVFAEVRSRRAGSVVAPGDTLTVAKRQRLVRCAELFRRDHGLTALRWRIDLVAVEFSGGGIPRVVDHLRDCIGADGRV